MKTLKDLVIIFLAGIGIHRVVQDILYWIDPELVARKDAGYFSVIAFIALYFTIKYLKERDKKRSATGTEAMR